MDVPGYQQDFVAEILRVELDTALRKNAWATVLGLTPFVDGNQWCVLAGEDLQRGIAAFGDTPEKAIWAFDDAMKSSRA